MELVGRHTETARIRQLLEAALSGIGGLLALSGPAGVGRTALLDAADAMGRRLGFVVLRASGEPHRLAWMQLLRDIGEDGLAQRLINQPSVLELDSAAKVLASGQRRLILLDDLDTVSDTTGLLPLLSSRLTSGSTAVIVTSRMPLGIRNELVLGGLTPDDVIAMFPDLSDDSARALWTASRGRPGIALAVAGSLGSAKDPTVHLALHAVSNAEFLDVDADLVALIERALWLASDDATGARLRGRLAYELMADQAAASRRRALVAEAIGLARRSGDQRALAEVLDARLHALWDPAGAADRLSAADEIIELAHEVADTGRERRGLFWRFVALTELARLDEAESALSRFEKAARDAGDADDIFMATGRQAMLAALRGRFTSAAALTDETAAMGERLGLRDASRLVGALRGMIGLEKGEAEGSLASAALLLSYARWLPGHYIEATAARLLAIGGEFDQALAELERVLPSILAGSGPRWLGAMTDLSAVARSVHATAAAQALYPKLLPYAGRLVIYGGANMVTGPVDHYLGLLALEIEAVPAAIDHFSAAIATEQRIGALPWLARSLEARSDAYLELHDPRSAVDREQATALAQRLGVTLLQQPVHQAWSLRQQEGDWLLTADDEHARLRDAKGLHYLRTLLAAPGQEISALDLFAGDPVPAAPQPMDTVIDEQARRQYVSRVEQLDAELTAADRAGDQLRGAEVAAEREALIRQLRGATGLGGRLRSVNPEAESARVNVTRALRTTIDRIAAAAPKCGGHLQASIRTGGFCRYQPGPGGPSQWQV